MPPPVPDQLGLFYIDGHTKAKLGTRGVQKMHVAPLKFPAPVTEETLGHRRCRDPLPDFDVALRMDHHVAPSARVLLGLDRLKSRWTGRLDSPAAETDGGHRVSLSICGLVSGWSACGQCDASSITRSSAWLNRRARSVRHPSPSAQAAASRVARNDRGVPVGARPAGRCLK
jgi:hypothetical protein